MNTKREKSKLNPSVNRRTFLKVSGVLASAAVAGPVFTKSKAAADPPDTAVITGENLPDDVETAADILYSTCQMCHSRCGVRAKVKEGILVKIDGNPYHPNNRDVDENNEPDRLYYSGDKKTDPADAVTELGRMCLKGQSGVQTVYDPFRIQHPLRRKKKTPRNSGQWEAISWETAFTEIAAKIDELIPPKERDDYINPAMPELGKKRNQLGFAPGRSVEKEMSERIWKHGWGTANYGLSHTSICEETRHVANELITWDPTGSKNSLGAGRTEGWQPDILGWRRTFPWSAWPAI
jgi:anaerobic selenocysteine-containing dehydrogenase